MTSSRETQAEAQISAMFAKHYEYYGSVGNETRTQQLNSERSIKLQYGGRATFELLQNAFDRAEKTVLIAQTSSLSGVPLLVVGNDGNQISFDSDFDYKGRSHTGTTRRSDFHALCSLHTSNKHPDESIGNKGVGFRSVFSLADHVRVYSRVPDSDCWWGMELHWCLNRKRMLDRLELPAVRDGWKRLLDDREIPLLEGVEHPSFYFPLPIWHDGQPESLPTTNSPISTFIEVPLEGEVSEGNAQRALAELQQSHFWFVGLRESKRDLTVTVSDERKSWNRRTWPCESSEAGDEPLIVFWPPGKGWTSPELDSLAKLAVDAEHAVSSPRVALAWSNSTPKTMPRAMRFCYLPTLVSSPLGIDVHADFQLGIDRTTLKSEDTDAVGRYNRALLEVAAELHLICCLSAIGFNETEVKDWAKWLWITEPQACKSAKRLAERQGHHVWRFLHPRDSTDDHQVRHLEQLLFGTSENWRSGDDSAKRWAHLAEKFFAVDRPLYAFDEFWQATKGWLDANPFRLASHTKTWKKWALALCDTVRDRSARVVPIISTSEVDSDTIISSHEPLPDRPGSGGGRAESRLYVRRGLDESGGEITLPEMLRRRRRLITCYSFADGFNDLAGSPNPTAALSLDRAALLSELRQLPTNAAKWTFTPVDDDAEKAEALQHDLLKFAAELFVAGFGTQKSLQDQFGATRFTWRIEHGLDLAEGLRATGRALATVFLPTVERNWQPARQLTQDQICREWATKLTTQVPKLNPDRFLSFLGVAPAKQHLVLIEDGDHGIIAPVVRPPVLVDADSSPKRPATVPIAWLTDIHDEPFVDLIRVGWPIWLHQLVHKEVQNASDSSVSQTLNEHDWYPVGSNGARPPVGADSTVMQVSPSEVVLKPLDNRRAQVVWNCHVEKDIQILGEIGAIRSLSDDDLRSGNATFAIRLWKQVSRLNLEQIACNPVARQGLLELFQSVMDAITATPDLHHEPLPLLAYEPNQKETPFLERDLRWIAADDDGWIAESNGDRELLRRFFPNLRVVSATLGPNRVKRLPWLAARAIKVQDRVCYVRKNEHSSSTADEIRNTLEELLPALLALAEVSRLINERINPQEVANAWETTRFMHVENVWVEYSSVADDHSAQKATWLEETRNDVLLDKDSHTIFFDFQSSSEERPALRGFGEALASRLLNNRLIGPAWSNAITEYDYGGEPRLRDLLRKAGAQNLCESYQRALKPLSSARQQALVQKIQLALSTVKTELKEPDRYSFTRRTLSSSDLVEPPGGWGTTTEESVQESLDDAPWTPEEIVFKPDFQCREDNRQAWEKWLEASSHRLRLLVLAHELVSGATLYSRKEAEALLGTAMAQQLSSTSSSLFGFVEFDPELVAKTWLSDSVADIADRLEGFAEQPLEQLLPPVVRYKKVSTIAAVNVAQWVRASVSEQKPTDKVLSPMTPEQRKQDDEEKAGIGADAESALRDLIVQQTTALLATDAGAWDILSTALPKQGVVRQKFENARQADGPLCEALHVSATWGSAGYDFLGLEQSAETGAVEAVRYEVKGLPAGHSVVRVFLSPNELAVYKRTIRNGTVEPDDPRYRGAWRLIGVEPKGSAVDITELLSPLLDDADGPLARLGRDGFAPEGLVLSINRRPSEGESPSHVDGT